MPLVVRQNNYVAGALIVASQNNTNETTLYNLVNGNLDEDNFASLAESVVTWNTSTGHTHDGTTSGGALIDNSGAGYLLQLETTGSDHAIKGKSSSGSAHAGLFGEASTAAAYGGYFDNTSATSTAIGLVATASGGGVGISASNKSGAAGASAIEVKHQSATTSGVGAIKITEVVASGYGLLAEDVDGTPVRLTASSTPSINGLVDINMTATAACDGVQVTDARTSGEGIVVSRTGGSGGTGISVSSNAASGTCLILSGTAGRTMTLTGGSTANYQSVLWNTGSAAMTTQAFFEINGADIDLTGGGYMVQFTKSELIDQAGTLVKMDMDTTGNTGTAESDSWVLNVENTQGDDDDNCAYFGGRVAVDGNLFHGGSQLGFYGTATITKPTVSGAKGGNVALTNLMTTLSNLGLLVDSTT